MHSTRFRDLVTASVLASAVTLAACWLGYSAVVAPEPAFARSPVPPDVVLHAMPRGSEGKNESFIFYNAKTGDIWVYRDYKFRDHYRLTALGENMEQIE